jgi:hypothetical protein
MTTTDTDLPQTSPLVSCHEALRIAHADALAAYHHLSRHRITLMLQEDGWHIDYDLTGPYMAGGGPHYVIDQATGKILSKRYYQ